MKRTLICLVLFVVALNVFPVYAQSSTGFDPIECPMPIPAEARVTCGEYEVPENRSNPQGRVIRMPFAILHSQDPDPQADPVVFVSSGGPGGSSLDALPAYINSAHLQARDFIFVEQRGNKYADPALECPEVQMAIFANFSTTDTRAIEIAREVEMARTCRDRLLAQGVDLTAYNSAESAADLEDLRTLLGYEGWNLVGASYSARLVLTAMRLYPAGIRSVVLDSIYSPEVNAYEQRVPTLARALETLFANCVSDPECGTAYPELEEHFFATVERMNSQPLAVEVSHPILGEPFTLQLTGDDLVLGIFNALYQRNTIRFLPFIIEELYRGNEDVIQPVAQEGFKNIFSRSQGMYYSTECREEFPFNSPEAQKDAAGQYHALANFMPSPSEPAICELWGAGVADMRQNMAVISDIPALVLAGEYDPVTSPLFTQAAAENLSNSSFYLLPYFGHSVQDQSNCANQLAAAFIQDPTHKPAANCLQNLSQLDFVTVDRDILPTRLVFWLNQAVLERKNPAATAIIVLCAAIFLIQLLAGAMKIKSTPPLTTLPPTLIAITNLFALLWFYNLAASTDSTLLGFGLPASASALVGLWFAVGGLTLVYSGMHVLKRPRVLLPALTAFSSLVLQVMVIFIK